MTRFKPLNILLIFLSILICIAFFVLLPYKLKESYQIGLAILGTCLFAILILWIVLNFESNSEVKKELLKEFIYIFHDSTIAWVLGLLVGSIISGTIMLFFGKLKYTHAEVNPSAFDIVSIYVGSVLGVLAIRAFYKSLHPIYNELDLIKMITKDLASAKANEKIWFSFPAFNLCHFRVETNIRNTGKEDFEAFVEELNAKISSNHYEVNGICYTKDNIEKLYDKYGEINASSIEATKLANAVSNCKSVASGFYDNMTTTTATSMKTNYFPLKPENPIESFVIIGEIVYTIQAWGLPIFKNGNFEDAFTRATGSKLVKLIAYRQHDKELSRTIIERTKSILN